jgi:putative FmdB family regulatory protein
MPIYEYSAKDAAGPCCDYCAERFEHLQKIGDAPLAHCPLCGAPVVRLISAPAVGRSQSSLDNQAKSAGFHKLKRLGKGEYEKQY